MYFLIQSLIKKYIFLAPGILGGWGAGLCEIVTPHLTGPERASCQGNWECGFPSVSGGREPHLCTCAWSQGQPEGKNRALISHSLEGESQELPVVGGYPDVKVGVFQVQRKEPVLWADLREDLFQCSHPERAFHKGTLDRGWAAGCHPFWGWGSNGCKSLTRYGLGQPPQWPFSPENFSLRHAGHMHKWRPLRRSMGVSERIEMNSLVLLPTKPTLWHWVACQASTQEDGVGFVRVRKTALF